MNFKGGEPYIEAKPSLAPSISYTGAWGTQFPASDIDLTKVHGFSLEFSLDFGALSVSNSVKNTIICYAMPSGTGTRAFNFEITTYGKTAADREFSISPGTTSVTNFTFKSSLENWHTYDFWRGDPTIGTDTASVWIDGELASDTVHEVAITSAYGFNLYDLEAYVSLLGIHSCSGVRIKYVKMYDANREVIHYLTPSTMPVVSGSQPYYDAAMWEDACTGKKFSNTRTHMSNDFYSYRRNFTSNEFLKERDREAYIEFEVTSSGESFLVPMNGRAGSGTTGIAYNVYIAVNGVEFETVFSGISAPNGGKYIEVTSAMGIIPGNNTITITPATKVFGWGRAFGFAMSSSNENSQSNKDKLVKVTNCPEYAYMTSSSSYGNNFQANQFYACRNLVSISDYSYEGTIFINSASVANGVFGTNHRALRCYNCTSLRVVSGCKWPKFQQENELDVYTVTMESAFKSEEFYGCTGLESVDKDGDAVVVQKQSDGSYAVIHKAVFAFEDNAFYHRFYGCSALEDPCEKPTSWYDYAEINGALSGFCEGEYYGCTRLRYPEREFDLGAMQAGQNRQNFYSARYQNCYNLQFSLLDHGVYIESALNNADFTYLQSYRSNMFYECSKINMENYIAAVTLYNAVNQTEYTDLYNYCFALSNSNDNPDGDFEITLPDGSTVVYSEVFPMYSVLFVDGRRGMPSYINSTASTEWGM